MKSVRRSCFETNSSSLHSIVITENDTCVDPSNRNEFLGLHPHKDGECNIPYRAEYGFGREFQFLDTFSDKLSYALCEYLGYADEKLIPHIIANFEEICRKYVEGFDHFDPSDIEDIGWIDHQSAGKLRNFIKKHEISLEEFLTNKKYVIVVDGDEYHYFDRMIEAGLMDMKYIKEVY